MDTIIDSCRAFTFLSGVIMLLVSIHIRRHNLYVYHSLYIFMAITGAICILFSLNPINFLLIPMTLTGVITVVDCFRTLYDYPTSQALQKKMA